MAKKSFRKTAGHLASFGKVKITILPELKEFIPALLDKEQEQLEANIIKEGLREPLLVWERISDNETEYVLIDGHNRYDICQRNKINYKTKIFNFEGIEQVKNWMIDNQLGRRNLNPEQVSYLRGLRYNREKQGFGGTREASGQNVHLKTSEKLANEYNVTERTIRRDSQYSIGLDKIGESNPELKKQILSGEVKVNKSDVQKLGKMDTDIVVESPEQLAEVVQKETKPVNSYVRRTKAQVLKDTQKRIPILKKEIQELSLNLESRSDVLELEKRIKELKKII